jgi:hypothetical protein
VPHAMFRTGEDIISEEFKRQGQGQGRTHWRDVWESRFAKPGKNRNSPRALGKLYKDYASTERAQEVPL